MTDQFSSVEPLTYQSSVEEPSPLAWCWFSSPRAIVDRDAPEGPMILAGAVSGKSSTSSGDIVILWMNLKTGQTGSRSLHANFEEDDHNDPALMIRPDGRYLAVYAKHNTDTLLRWRLSTEPHDPTAWQPERTLDVGAQMTYANVYRQSDRTFCLSRAINWDPTVVVSTDDGGSWSVAGRMLTFNGPGQRPYPRYVQDDAGDVHLITTEAHPHRWENGIGYGVIRDGRLMDADGTTLVQDIGVRHGDPADVRSLTTVFETNSRIDGDLLTRAWTVDIVAVDDRPVAIVQARHEDDRRTHRFLYCQLLDETWHVESLAPAGGYFYAGEWDYTGLAAIDPTDPNRVLVSTTVDPETGRHRDRYGIFAGTRRGDAHWSWEPVAVSEDRDFRRPILIGAEDPVALWMTGEYRSYRDWETTVECCPAPF